MPFKINTIKAKTAEDFQAIAEACKVFVEHVLSGPDRWLEAEKMVEITSIRLTPESWTGEPIKFSIGKWPAKDYKLPSPFYIESEENHKFVIRLGVYTFFFTAHKPMEKSK